MEIISARNYKHSFGMYNKYMYVSIYILYEYNTYTSNYVNDNCLRCS